MVKCEKCDKEFGSEEALNMHNKSKHPELYKEPKRKSTGYQKKKILNWSIFIIIIIAIIGGIIFLFLNTKTLPPTSMSGHVEENPPSHVMRVPMLLTIQKHMLEHADGSGPPGVIINYNCDDFRCDDELITKLEAFADKYPENVYVAPFPKMDAKIALTKLGKIKELENYDEEVIDNFINAR